MRNEILKGLADNAALFDAVKEVITKQFTVDQGAPDMTNEQLGALTRARIEGLAKVEAAFQEISTYKTVAPKPELQNPAR